MKVSNVIMVSAAVLALGIGALHLFDRLRTGAPAMAKAAPEPAPAATPEPLSEQPPQEAGTPEAGTPPATDAGVMPQPPAQLVAEIERVLVAADSRQRETAFNSLLPQLLQDQPGSVVAMVARQPPGEARDALREEVTRHWIGLDRDTAIEWIDTLPEAEKKASALTAMRTLGASSPALAVAVADRFGVGRDDGSLEHLVQIWAAEKPDEALAWLATQPEGPQTEQLRARIEQTHDPKP
jgi:hypothetical protein